MNGAVMNNFVSLDMPFASAVLGDGSLFVSEVDESDGSIALYDPTIAVLNNVSEDHKSMAELRQLFGDYLGRARHAVINVDDPETRVLGGRQVRKQTYSVTGRDADLVAKAIKPEPTAIGFEVWERGRDAPVVMTLPVPGHHNVSNALAALSVARLLDVPLEAACEALSGFGGIRRRFDVVGTKNDVTVIDDFGHNPDKIAATLRTLHAFSGRLLVMFQPHGFGPLRLMRREFVEMFRAELAPDDVLVMPEPVYFGGTVNRTVTTGDLVDDLKDAGVAHAEGFATRDECGHRLRELARPGDRIIIMGARDDTLAVFARDLLKSLPT